MEPPRGAGGCGPRGADQLGGSGLFDPEAGCDYFDARDFAAHDSVNCGTDYDADDRDEFDIIYFQELVDSSKSDQLSGSCDAFTLTYLPVITTA